MLISSVFLLFSLFLLSVQSAEHLLHHILRLRHQTLHRFVTGSHTKHSSCPTDKYVLITEYQFGRTGNNIIELTHGLWVAEKLNATLVVPEWMAEVFAPFNTSLLQAHYCYVTSTAAISKTATRYEVTSEESFFAFKLFQDPRYAALLPPMSEHTVHELSLHFLRVYSALWCCPQRRLLQAVEYIVLNHLDGNFGYASVHKRQLEGGCAKIMSTNTKPTEYSPRQLPMTHPEWSGNLAHAHPLCEMTYSFVRSTLEINHHNDSFFFVAYDGRGSVEDYKAAQCVFSNVLDNSNALRQGVDRKFVDMLVAMHSDFFVLNPRSTFSWQIYLVRLVLSLPSVPIVRGNDLYMQKVPEELAAAKRGLWVSWTSTMNALMGPDEMR